MQTTSLWPPLFVALTAIGSLSSGQKPKAAVDDFDRALNMRFASRSFTPIRDADRAEALPVEIVGEGLTSTHRVREQPVALDAETTGEIRRTILRPDSYLGGPMGCMFQPMFALRFHKGRDWMQVLVCFSCDELVFERPRQTTDWQDKLAFTKEVRARLLGVAKKAFPDDPSLPPR